MFEKINASNWFELIDKKWLKKKPLIQTENSETHLYKQDKKKKIIT